MMIKSLLKNELLLLSGNDIPFTPAQITIHPLRLKEIAYIGEEVFFTGCELLRFSKDILSDEDKFNLTQYNDFQILMSILNDKSGQMHNNVSAALSVLSLIFPLYVVTITPDAIVFSQDGEVRARMTAEHFEDFKRVISAMFCLEKTSQETTYNAQGELAKQIAEKFKKRKQKLAELKQKPEKVAIFSKYISVLAVGEHKDINSFMNYTVYQLFDELQRFELKEAYDMYLKARLSGASELKEPEDWRKDLHS